MLLILSTCDFSLLTRKFELVSRGFELVTREFEIVSHGFELVTREFELVTRGLELVICGFELVTRALLFHATGDLIGTKIADKITSLGKTKSKEKEGERQEVYISPEKRQQVIDDLRCCLYCYERKSYCCKNK